MSLAEGEENALQASLDLLRPPRRPKSFVVYNFVAPASGTREASVGAKPVTGVARNSLSLRRVVEKRLLTIFQGDSILAPVHGCAIG